MATFTFNLELKNNGYIELSGQRVKYWSGEGLPVFEGNLDGLNEAYPGVIQELIDQGVIQRD